MEEFDEGGKTEKQRDMHGKISRSMERMKRAVWWVIGN